MNHLLRRAWAPATLLLAVGLGAGPTPSSAAVVLGASQGFASSFNAPFAIENTYDQSGLSLGYVSGSTDFDSYLASGPTHAADGINVWVSTPGDAAPVITHDLGAMFMTSAASVWVADYLPPALADFWGSPDGAAWVLLDDDVALLAPGVGVDAPAQLVSWAPQAMRYLQMRMTCRPNDDACGIGEIAVRGEIAEISEPGSLAMLLLAGAALGWQRRGHSPRSLA
jgi:hypothetical protein